MTINYLNYKLDNGFINHWLVAGPFAVPVRDLSLHSIEDIEKNIGRKSSKSELDVTIPPVELGGLGAISEENPSLYWRYYRCLYDHLVDFSAEYLSCHFLRSWAYTCISLNEETQCKVLIGSYSTAKIWLNGQLIHTSQLPESDWQSQLKPVKSPYWQKSSFPVSLQAGMNHLMVRFDILALRQTSYAFALQLIDFSDQDVGILLPTEIEEDQLEKRQTLETIIEHAYLDRYVYGYLDGDHYDKNEPILLAFSSNLENTGSITHRLQSLQGDIFQSGYKDCQAGAEFELARLFPLRNGPHHLALLPVEHDYYIQKIQFERKDPFWIVRTPYSTMPHGKFEDRSQEALEDAVGRRNDNIFIEVAKIAQGHWDKLNSKSIEAATNRIQYHQDKSVFDLLAFLSIILRFSDRRKLPKELRNPIRAAIKNYRYWVVEPQNADMDFFSESQQMMFHTCEILAGQIFPEVIFHDSGKSGKWHQEHGEVCAINLMRNQGHYGFVEWDSPEAIESELSALSHLVDLAQSEEVRELAAVLMDKIFFSLAVNSWKGMLGSSQGFGDTGSVLSHRLEATSGICRLMWGMGNFNESVIGTVSLAICQRYKLPDTLKAIALDSAPALWSRERCKRPTSENKATPALDWEINKVIYKTSDYMLASAQDYHPGEPGGSEHIWQATLGPDSVVFVNHPVKSNDMVPPPNLWVGNRILPRVAQWGDLLISIHNNPQDDWLGFTHAYFPVSSFDEYFLNKNWALARKGNGYLALFARNGLDWITTGRTAFREIRSYGTENIWLCQMGQKMLDGSFAKFQEKILEMDLATEGLSVKFNSLRGEDITFNWTDPLKVNGLEQAISGFQHIENIYCNAALPNHQMDILIENEGIRLSF